MADVISDVGSWHRWLTGDDIVQVQFCNIMIYDEKKAVDDLMKIADR